MRASMIALLSVLLGMPLSLAVPAPGAGKEASKEESELRAAVMAENNTTHDVWVYLLQGGHMVPLGLVPSMGDVTLSITSSLLESGEPVHFIADPLGTTDWHKSEPVSVGAGDTVLFVIEPDLASSTISVTV
jgi:hypothetical protein